MRKNRTLRNLNKKQSIGIASLVLLCVIAVFVGSKALLHAENYEQSLTAISHGVALNNTIPSETGTKGTETNPFVILEIVPSLELAEIGYLIGGCEPVDTDRILREDHWKFSGLISNNTTEYKNRYINRFELTDADRAMNYIWTQQGGQLTQKGNYLKVEQGKGTHYYSTSSNQFIKHNNNDTNNCDFIWIEEDVEDQPSNKVMNPNELDIGGKYYTTRMEYNWFTAYEYVNTNLFLKEVIGLSEEQIADYHVVVKTIVPSELNKNLQWITRADMMYINAKSHVGALPELWKTYNKQGIRKQDIVLSGMFGGNEDLSWEATLAIFNKAITAKDYAPIIYDRTVYYNYQYIDSSTKETVETRQNGITPETLNKWYVSGNYIGSNSNMYKLAIMLRTMDPEVFNKVFLETGLITSKSENGKTTGYFTKQVGNAATYWNNYTFMPTKADGNQAFWDDWNTGEGWTKYKTNPTFWQGDIEVSKRVYSYNGDNSLSMSLTSNNIWINKNNKELFDALESGNNSATPAEAIKFILGLMNSNEYRKTSINVLELQPCADFSLTEAMVRSWLPGYTGEITIVSQSTAQFNGMIEDLNTEYDLIYLGLNYGRMNTGSVNGETLPVYNDSNLDGKIYLHVGDQIECLDFTVNWLNEPDDLTTRASGNDITALRKKELKEFADAKGTIIVENDLFNTGTERTKLRVAETTNIYKFVDETKKYDNVVSKTSADQGKTVAKLIIEMSKPNIIMLKQPTLYNGSNQTGYISATEDGKYLLEYKFTITEGSTTSNDTYTAKIYVDINGDGSYDGENEILLSQSGIQADGSTVHITKELTKEFIGAIPWKLEVSCETQGMQSVRNSVSGLSAIKIATEEKKSIKVLQINVGEENISKLDIAKNVKDKGLFYKYTNDLNDFEIYFETITVKQYEERFAANPFDAKTELTKAKTDQLVKQYDMLIFGFGDSFDDVSPNGGALDNLLYFIECGRSVLFTHDTTSYRNTPGAGYSFSTMFRDVFGMDRFGARLEYVIDSNRLDGAWNIKKTEKDYTQIHGFTNHILNRIGRNNKRTIWKGYEYNTSISSYDSHTAVKLNDGQITQYPYYIGDMETGGESIQIANTHAQYYQLNLENEDIVVWYTLSGKYEQYSPKDASNSYYIYSNGNVTYSGVGHSEVGNADNEVKLFINTMVAAYNRSYELPVIEITNDDTYKEDDKSYNVYINEDYLNSYTTNSDKVENIYFKPNDFNLGSQYVLVHASTQDNEIFTIYNAKGEECEKVNEFYKLAIQQTYHIKWNRSYINNSQKRTIEFITKNSFNVVCPTTVNVIRRNLFDLD